MILHLYRKRYSLKLHFKKTDVQLPNSFKIAKQRMLGLKRKFLNNPEFHKEYSSCLNDVIQRGYAEKVPPEQSQGSPGKVWYIPHHGVYHPKKGSL